MKINLLKKFGIGFLLLILVPLNIKASEKFSTYLNCDGKFEKGQNIICDLYVESNTTYNGYEADLITSKGITINSFTVDEKFDEGTFNNNKFLILGSWKNKTKLGTLNITIDKNIKNDISLKFVNIKTANMNTLKTEKAADYEFSKKTANYGNIITIIVLILIPLVLILAIIILINKKKEVKNEKN